MKFPPSLLLGAFLAATVLPVATLGAKAEKKANARAAAGLYTALDKNGDGVVTRLEYVTGMKDRLGEEGAAAHFSELDKNHDGKLAGDELGGGREGTKKEKRPGKKKKVDAN